MTGTASVYRPVLETFTTHPDELVHVNFRTDDGAEETLSGTPGHPFYVIEREQFVHAQDLQPGETLALPEGRTATVLSLRREFARPGATFTTYNFEVAETHTYFVGKLGAWVHNASDYLCQRMAVLYDKYTDTQGSLKLSPEEAFRRLENLVDGRVKGGRMTLSEGRRHVRDAMAELKRSGRMPGNIVLSDQWVVIRNKSLAGNTHPTSGVPFNSGGFPAFDSFHDVRLPTAKIGPHISDAEQFKHATKDLWEYLRNNPNEMTRFNRQQRFAIQRGDANIPGLTWHHHEDGIRLQLVDRLIHDKTAHTGGRALTGGR